ncbi:MAG TPA: ABC transporter ATP-binding protein, partial [Limnochordia bacterium]
MLQALFSAAMMAWLINGSGNAQISLIVLGVLPIHVLLPVFLAHPFRAAFRRVQDLSGEAATILQESIGGSREIAAFGLDAWDRSRVLDVLQRSLAARLRAIVLEAQYGGMQHLLQVAPNLILMAVGAGYVFAGAISIGSLLAILQWTNSLYGSVTTLYRTSVDIQKALGAGERLHEFLLIPVAERSKPTNTPVAAKSAAPVGGVGGAVAFRDVTFVYPGADRPALASVSFEAGAGERIAIVGPSGAGKSTLVYLLLRLYEPTAGRIEIDGTDIRNIPASEWRRCVGVVFQDPTLFSTSIAENIALGRLGATSEEVRDAARRANAADFIEDLPAGYDTVLGERGTGLSIGQRQRLAIARACLRDPRILVLDEATSALDGESERRVVEAVTRLAVGRTVFIVAHRLSTV